LELVLEAEDYLFIFIFISLLLLLLLFFGEEPDLEPDLEPELERILLGEILKKKD